MWYGLLLASVLAHQWGLFNPGAYMSLRSKAGEEAGFMWGGEYKLNHQMQDEILVEPVYGEPGTFYMQTIQDPSPSINLTHTTRISGDSWISQLSARHVQVKRGDIYPEKVNVVFYYVGKDQEYINDTDWTSMHIEMSESTTTYIRSLKLGNPMERAAKIKQYTQKWLVNSSKSRGFLHGNIGRNITSPANMVFHQWTLEPPFLITVKYNSPPEKLSAEYIKDFKSKFQKTYGEPVHEKFEHAVISNLMSGIGLFNGSVLVEFQNQTEYEEPKMLLSHTPSRSNFPRGFLWDEGFHLLVTSVWSPETYKEITKSWLDTMDYFGWIPREQIRGTAAEELVPKKFIPQNIETANPPTLILPILQMLRKPEDEIDKDFLNEIYPKLQVWLSWMLNRQRNSEGFNMWKGRTMGQTLASGLDDYPRGLIVSPLERHLDYQMWLHLFLKSMAQISWFLDYKEESEIYEKLIEVAAEETEKGFFNGTIYTDYLGSQYVEKDGTLPFYWRGDNKCGRMNKNILGKPAECNPYSDSPCCSESGWCGDSEQHCNCKMCTKAKKLEERSDLVLKEMFSPHIGYVTLMPFIVGYLKSSTQPFEHVMEYITNEKYLWTDFGLRSLSASDPLYKTDDNYWRGAIWINFNYLVLRAMKIYYWDVERVQEVYQKLKDNVVSNIKDNWDTNHYLWEQYDDMTGQGKRAHPFAGWTTLVINIIHDIY